ncbi:MAG: Phospholipid/glycerol acyltransferase [Verrucomicrobiaceae bacterium]|nr:Phospholipid/glycerol acyltransferase [Verrucomicrobiaceae bacterium]
MRSTLFRVPFLSPVLARGAAALLFIFGWRVVGALPDQRKYVLIAAPHTSNWDFPLMLLAVLKIRMDLHWLGKSSLFRAPFGALMQWLGGVPVDRSKSNNLVGQLVEQFKQCEQLVVLIPPEGTRTKVERWKSGFYYVAAGAGVPLLLGFIDASRRQIGFGPFFYPTGDYAADLIEIQKFYADKTGLRGDAR